MTFSHATSPVNTFAPAASGYNTPLVTLPLADHNAPLVGDTLESVDINHQWRRLLVLLATGLLNRNIYDGTEAEIDTAIQQAHALLADFYPLAGIMAISHALIVAEKATGVHGGASVVGWNNRDLNTIVSDPDSIVTLAANKFKPDAGDYLALVTAATLASTINTKMRARLRNATTSAIVGTSLSSLYLANTTENHIFPVLFTANGTDEYQVDSYHSVARTITGLGFAADDGSPERYVMVYLLKLS